MPEMGTIKNNSKKMKRKKSRMGGEKADSKNSVKMQKPSASSEEGVVLEADSEKQYDSMTETSSEHLEEAVAESEFVDRARFEGAEEFDSSAQASGDEEFVSSEAGDSSFNEDAKSAEAEEQKVHLEFYGSEYIREKAPQVMEFAESVADEWQKDGSFEDIPVNHPLAQMVVAKALRKAKDVEKALEEKGVLSMARIGVDFVKSKIDRKHE